MNCTINKTSELVCGLPFCAQNRKQTKFSIGLRTTAGILGGLVAVIGILALCHIQGLSLLGLPGGVTMVSLGSLFCFIALAVKCVAKKRKALSQEDQTKATSSKPVIQEDLTYTIPTLPTSSKPVVDVSQITQSVLETSRQELEAGITLSDEVMTEMKQLMHLLRQGKDHPDIVWHARQNNLIFSLKKAPDLVFKMSSMSSIGGKGSTQRTKERFDRWSKLGLFVRPMSWIIWSFRTQN